MKFGKTANEDTKMRLIEKHGEVEIWEVTEAYGSDFYVYGVLRDPIVCPSLDMARSKLAK